MEIVVATAVFVALAAGVMGTTVMARRSMNQAIMRNIAFDTAQGLLDQIKGRKFGTLLTAMSSLSTSKDAYLTLTCNDIAHKNSGNLVLPVNGAGFLKLVDNTGSTHAVTGDTLCDQRVPLHSTDRAETDSDKALLSMSYLPEYGLRVEMTAVNDGATGSNNAILVTVRYRFKYLPGGSDADFKTGSVSYLAPNL